MTKQKRTKWRLEWIIPAAYELLSTGKEKHSLGWGFIHNLSEGGCEFWTRFPLTLNDNIKIKFFISGREAHFLISGAIVRQNKKEIYRTLGIRFIGDGNLRQAKSALALLIKSQW